ncbi:MAG: hypothetical protein DI555_06865 [Novosphingobium pentaromativorans]|uniref:Uncharacterized protein n=1 Tax=Novosphingobium pentaromativorans TaxID=205844 RepID=A0A2W5NQE8_9SPHN|nr:MAG: hypothetical protein DI555_06865 [Novosphingobium pentaromativorans]
MQVPMADLTWFGLAATGVGMIVGIANIKARVFRDKLTGAYIDADHFKSDRRLRICGEDADLWRVSSVRAVWPLHAKFLIDDPVYDDGGSIIAPVVKSIGRVVADYRGGRLLPEPSSSIILATMRSKANPRLCKRTLLRHRMNP